MNCTGTQGRIDFQTKRFIEKSSNTKVSMGNNAEQTTSKVVNERAINLHL